MPFQAGSFIKKDSSGVEPFVKNISTPVEKESLPVTFTKIGNISVKNLVVKSEEIAALSPQVPVSNTKEIKENRVMLEKKKAVIDDIKEPSVVVDGKIKKISKKSAFLLDMLSLDD